MVVNVKNMIDDELFFGHKACAGCGGSLALRAALKVLGPNAVAALPAGCTARRVEAARPQEVLQAVLEA